MKEEEEAFKFEKLRKKEEEVPEVKKWEDKFDHELNAKKKEETFKFENFKQEDEERIKLREDEKLKLVKNN